MKKKMKYLYYIDSENNEKCVTENECNGDYEIVVCDNLYFILFYLFSIYHLPRG
jgi:hypothetical protein